jgi:maltose/moltooligosaccharide transporter
MATASCATSPDPPPTASPSEPGRWTVGTLSYDRKQLGWLIFWLLWGDFTLTLMVSVMPQLLPISLKGIGASNILIGFVTASLPTAMNVFMNPFISTISDRHRGPRGRRIPFLLWPTPLITLFLILIGFSPDIGGWLAATGVVKAMGWASTGVILVLVCVFVVAYQFFNLFVGSVYYYLFADVVPTPVMGRFLGLLRIVSQLALFIWGRWIFGLAETHMRSIYIGIGLLYLVSFLLMCWKIREGQYAPPPKRLPGGRISGWVRTYVKECFHAPIYLWIFLITTVCWFANSANTLFIFFSRDGLGLKLDAIGKINAWGTLVTIPLALVFGYWVDKIHGLRMAAIGVVIMALGGAVGFFTVHDANSLLAFSLVYQIGFLAFTTAMMPMYIALFPADRFGQFCSANSMISSVGIVLGNALCGWFIDAIGDYRWLLAWEGVFFTLTLIPWYLAWHGWHRHGGPSGYRPPMPDTATSTTP